MYRYPVQTVIRSSYRSHYRRMLPKLLQTLEFRSNNAVARLILGPGTPNRTSGFVRIPLDMREPSQKLFFMDSLDWNTPPWRQADWYREFGELGYPDHPETWGTWAFRHLFDGRDGRMNGLFFDGSVRNLPPEQVDPAQPNGSWQNQRRLWFPYDEWGDLQNQDEADEVNAIFGNPPGSTVA
jgi:prepilin-type processing-associated H-X9-DG protein